MLWDSPGNPLSGHIWKRHASVTATMASTSATERWCITRASATAGRQARSRKSRLSSFAVGHAIRVIDHPGCTYSPQEVVERARSRVGERNYRLLTNNCEHFSNWCVSGLSRSAQTERSLVLALGALARAGTLVTLVLVTLAGLAREVVSGSRLRLQG